MAWSMIFSSSLFVTMTTGVTGVISLMRDKVSSPLRPGMFSSSRIRS